MTAFRASAHSALCACLLLTGCADLLHPPPKRDPNYAPTRAEDSTPPLTNMGAIFQPGYEIRLFEDAKARRIGDTLTILLSEQTKAQKSADSSASREGTTTVDAPVILGQQAAQILGHSLESSLKASNDFTGKGTSNQNNALTGSISVTVVEVLPNGNLRIQGEKRLGLNQGNEYIKLSGIVRPIDIDPANTVDSSKVADATMIYNGEGQIDDANRMGWLQRFFTSVIFPY
ncbi:flagellar basal body L-ring protein FlgH [Methylomagnum ishizawai]|uniref:flagellar basal body L-ring protein FlgH n=1 Tax=Methylomagnum ishizawai TaxID=1760988 RepID=UPI001C342B7B|nr:flagellar basal body L-ring protein FlgH [Methylomagnum ishizawai]BBL75620.1 flagellar L-ring protein [Methylomagnum ishizawai]